MWSCVSAIEGVGGHLHYDTLIKQQLPYDQNTKRWNKHESTDLDEEKIIRRWRRVLRMGGRNMPDSLAHVTLAASSLSPGMLQQLQKERSFLLPPPIPPHKRKANPWKFWLLSDYREYNLFPWQKRSWSRHQYCGTVMIYCGSCSYFGNVLVPVLAPVPVPVPDPDLFSTDF